MVFLCIGCRMCSYRILLFLALMPLSVLADVSITVCGYSGESSECPPETQNVSGGVGLANGPSNTLTQQVQGAQGRVQPGQKIDTLGLCSNSSGSWKCGDLPMKVGDVRGGPSSTPAGWSSLSSPPTQNMEAFWALGTETPLQGNNRGAEICTNYCSHLGKSVDPSSVYNAAHTFYQCNCQGGGGGSASNTYGGSCPAGYTNTNTSNTLGQCVFSENTNSRTTMVKWPDSTRDGKCAVEKVANNAWTESRRDPDCVSNGGTYATVYPTPHTQVGSGNTPTIGTGWDGTKSSAVQLNGDGSGKMTELRSNSDGKTTTKTDITFGTPGGDGKSTITGVSQTQIDGTGQATGLSSGAGGTGTTTPASTTQGGLDTSSLAKESTMQGIKGDLEGSNDYQGYGTAKTFAESMSEFKTAISGGPVGSMLSFAPANVSASCPTFNIPAFGQQLTMESFCDVGNTIMNTLNAVMTAVWAIAAIKVVFSA